MIEKELVIVGAGPAGLCAARIAAEAGCRVLLIDRSPLLGGQLIKQTHKFFGSEQQRAKTRGFRIAEALVADLEPFGDTVEIWREATVVGAYPDSVLTVWIQGEYRKIHFQGLILAVGAGERSLAFENNDLPGVYGAGAVQTLMNVYGVLPGKEIVMVGSGNIGLIVSYQLIQAGAVVKALVEAAPKIGGYKVHASKLRRLGVPILTRTTVVRALGDNAVRGVMLAGLDEGWNPIPGTKSEIACDAVCIAVGLSPLYQLAWMLGAETAYVGELGGMVPLLDENRQTTVSGVFAAGDAAGVEEASSAMVGGRLAGLHAARFLGHLHPDHAAIDAECRSQLSSLRGGPFGAKIRAGLKKAEVKVHAR